MRTVGTRLIACAALALVAGCSSGSSNGPGEPSASTTSASASSELVLVATPATTATLATLTAAGTVLQRRFADLGVTASVTVSGATLRVAVNSADADAARFLITEQGTLAFSQVLEARPKSPRRCRGSSHAFGAVASGDAVVCDPADSLILLLAPAALDESDVANAVATTAAGISSWLVDLTLTRSGAASWLELTRNAFAATGSPNTGFGTCKPPRGCNAIAVVIDGGLVEVPSVPQPGGLSGGDAAISANLSKAVAQRLAATLRSGALPVAFTVPAGPK